MTRYSVFPIILICLLNTACSTSTVQPWQKQDLARPEMNDKNTAVESGFEDHFYFSKEGSAGGRGFSGGGCGCN